MNGAVQAGLLLRVRRALGGFVRDARSLETREALLAAARKRPWQSAFGAAALLLLLLLGLRALLSDPATGVAMGEVREGPFRVTIVEAGTLQALRSVSYASAIQSNQAKIVALVPEGKLVEKGDLLILFDAAPFEEEIRKSQAALEQAEAELSKARQDQGLQQIQTKARGVVKEQTGDRIGRKLHDHFNDLGGYFIQRLEPTQQGGCYFDGNKRDRNPNNQSEEHEVKHVWIFFSGDRKKRILRNERFHHLH